MLGFVIAAAPFSARGQVTDAQVIDKLHSMGVDSTREVGFDLCFPATAQEYAALGKNAIVMLKASSVLETELPLRTAYLIQRGVRIPLQRVAVLDKHLNTARKAEQVSFYLIPIKAMKDDTELKVDFTGERKAFGVTGWSATGGLGAGVPAFVRLDEYDDPSDPDPVTIAQILTREYPSYFPKH